MRGRSTTVGVIAFLGTAAILAGTVAGLVGVGLGSVAGGILPELPPDCPTKSIVAPPLAGLPVKIHNAVNVEGLAAGMAQLLKARGITVESVGNKPAPDLAGAGADVVITATSGNLAPALALQGLFPQSVFLLDDDEAGTSLYLTAEKPAMTDEPVARKGTLRCVLEPPGP